VRSPSLVGPTSGHVDAAIEQLRQAADLYRDAGDIDGEARALGDLGNAMEVSGDLSGAVEVHRRALAAFAETGYAHGEAIEHGNLAIALAQLGDFAGAEEEARKAINLHERLDDMSLAAKCRLQLSGYLLRAGYPDDALAQAEASRQAYEHLGESLGVAAATAARARAQAVRQELDLAFSDHEVAERLFAQAGADVERARHMAEFADTLLDLHEVAAAHGLLERAVAITDRPGMQQLRIQLIGFLSELDERAGDTDRAEQRLRAELAAATQEGDEARIGLTLAALAQLHAMWGEADEARLVLSEARQLGMETSVEADYFTNVVITGQVSSGDRRKLGRLITQALLTVGARMERLQVDVRVHAAPEGPADWWADPEGIGLDPWLVATPDVRSQVRLEATLYGALVHHVLARDGVDSATPLGETLLGIARSWVQQHVFVVHGPMPEESPALPSLTRGPSGPEISAVFGAALAGNSVARARIEAWKRTADVDDVALMEHLRDTLTPITEPAELLEVLAAIYNTAAHGDEES
jgi:tetratricopeptide (TPR) repeat protein